MGSVTRPLILTVDDESEITELIRLHLDVAGYDVVTASSGEEALASTRRRVPDLILLDVMLPDIDGFGICEILRSCEETASIPIVMLTGCSSSDARTVGRDLGANDFLSKPFKPKDLIDRVKQLIARPAQRPQPRRKKSPEKTAGATRVRTQSATAVRSG